MLAWAVFPPGDGRPASPLQNVMRHFPKTAEPRPAQPILALTAAFEAVPARLKEQPDLEAPYRPRLLVPLDGQYALFVTSGEYACHACDGTLSVFYVRRNHHSVEVLGAWPDLYKGGVWGEVGDLARFRLGTGNPAVEITNSTMNQGCAVSWMAVVELTPSRPIVRFEAPMGASFEGNDDPQAAFDVRATVAAPRAGKGVEVSYRGYGKGHVRIDQRVRYAGLRDRWTAQPSQFKAVSC